LPENLNIQKLTDKLFRREAGKMVAVLTKIFGTENLETAEDVVQDTLLHALNVWKLKGVPDNPSAWLFRVAKNKAIDIIRRNKHSIHFDLNDSERILLTSEYTLNMAMENLWKEELIKDDLLRMMFACCHPEISAENQITLILKTLCGFSTAEIAKAFLVPEDTVSKRLYRTKEFFRKQKLRLNVPSVEELRSRTDAVLNSIYLLFNEGYNSSHSEELIRKNLVEEAMMLCKLLTENAYTQQPEVFALMALMCFHVSRSDSRLTAEGGIILLAKQDRRKWDSDLIAKGNEYMNRSAFGNTISSYHIEAAIAYEHCTAETFESTNWARILELYNWLCKIAPSPVTELNRAAVIFQVEGSQAALKALEVIVDKKKLENFHLYYSLSGEIYADLEQYTEAVKAFKTAINLTQSAAEQRLLNDKIKEILS